MVPVPIEFFSHFGFDNITDAPREKGSQLFFNSGIRFVQRMVIHVIEGFWLFWGSGGRGPGLPKNLTSKICVRRFIVSNMRFLVRGCM